MTNMIHKRPEDCECRQSPQLRPHTDHKRPRARKDSTNESRGHRCHKNDHHAYDVALLDRLQRGLSEAAESADGLGWNQSVYLIEGEAAAYS